MPARYQLLASWINRHGWINGVEIGVFSGRTHLHLLRECPGLQMLIGIDVWDMPGFSEGTTKSGEKCRCQYCEETRADRRLRTPAQMREFVVAEGAKFEAMRSMICHGTSASAAAHVMAPVDFVFIDGDHSTEGVAADIKLWKPKIKAGGWLIGHDWNMQSVRDGVALGLGVRPEDLRLQVQSADDHLWVVKC